MHSTALFTGKNRLHSASVDSTNNQLSFLSQQGRLPEGTAVTADFQTSGRGQRQAGWHSQSGMNLLVSFLFYPKNLSVRQIHSLNLMAAVAVSDVVESFTDEVVSIKWPNDIYVADKKIAGLLVETVLQGDLVRQVIVGLGLNVNQTVFPVELPNPVSLSLLTGNTESLDRVFSRVSSELESRYLQLRNSGLEALTAVFEERLYRKGLWAEYRDKEGEFEGRINGISDTGGLLLSDRGGNERSYEAKELKYL